MRDRKYQAPPEPTPSPSRPQRRAARRRAGPATRPRHPAPPPENHGSRPQRPPRTHPSGPVARPGRASGRHCASRLRGRPARRPLQRREHAQRRRRPDLCAQAHDLAACRAGQAVDAEHPPQQHTPRRPPRASGAGLRQPHPDPFRRDPALRQHRPHRPVPPVPRRQHAAVEHLVRSRRRHEGDEPLGELLGRQLERRRPVGLGPLQRDANPVARERLDPVQGQRWDFDPSEHPVALQLGGDDPVLLASAARRGAARGYDEINLNVGCPSSRVQSGSFGACLMLRPDHVAALVRAMRAEVDLPITVKCRIGVDEQDAYDDLHRFAQSVLAAGAARLSVHARKAWLHGLSPKENRNVPPLRYPEVYRLKLDFPEAFIEINGGITTLDQAAEHLNHVDAVMIGRGVWNDPWLLAQVDRRFYGEPGPLPDRFEVALAFADYAARVASPTVRPQHILRNLGPLFNGQPGSGAFKRALAQAHRDGTDAVRRGLDAVRAVQERAQSIS
ncbi:MAG: tRNA dihydrouridine(20/20a) synthase DusA [Deltaproteobacteria bacterium]|nr:MAG: tRNA dihydrouridine(20/20a) synthase DusA [Deltaproteobacteria bacterium]